MINFFLYQPQYLKAAQAVCSHIFFHMTPAVIMNKDV